MDASPRYARTTDGVTFAFTVNGTGPALVWLGLLRALGADRFLLLTRSM